MPPGLLLDCVPADFEIDRDESGFVITVPACESGAGMYLTLDCRFDEMPDHGIDTFEFSFAFTVCDLDGGTLPYMTQDRYDVVRYFGELSREFVLPTVSAALVHLVDHVQPAYIFRVTKGKNLPQKAMVKHFLVTETLLGLGYHVVDTGTDPMGRLFWMLGR